MENEISFVKIDDYNLNEYYQRVDGNLYMKNPDTGAFDVVDDFTCDELLDYLIFCQGKLIWIAGFSLGTVNVKY